MGGNVTININGRGTTTGGVVDTASRIDILIWHDSLCELSDGSVQISNGVQNSNGPRHLRRIDHRHRGPAGGCSFQNVLLYARPPAETGNSYQWQAGFGFTEANLVPSDSRIETKVLEDNEIIFARKTQ